VEAVSVREPTVAPVAVVASISHGGEEFPAGVVQPVGTAGELTSDTATRELYGFLPELGVATVETALSRYVADPNRDPGSGAGAFWTSVVATATAWDMELYAAGLSPEEVERRVAIAHMPYHDALGATIAAACARFPRVLLLDLHSFGMPLKGDVVVGNRHGATASPETTARVVAAFEAEGFRVTVNERFAGGWTIHRWADPPAVEAVQIELAKHCYLALDEEDVHAYPRRDGRFDATRSRLRRALTALTS
jgi:N-formylglutamate deformylase